MKGNILVTGSNGQLGYEVCNEIEMLDSLNSSPWDKPFFTSRNGNSGIVPIDVLDICDKQAVSNFIKENNIKVVINCAAWTNVDEAEEREYLCNKINDEAAHYLAKAINDVDGLLIHVSTDYVFSGNYAVPRDEISVEKPINAYGKSKFNGELGIRRESGDYAIVRTSWLYSSHHHNFVQTILNNISNGKDCSVVYDQVGSPTHAHNLAEALCKIAIDYFKTKVEGERWEKFGIYHYSDNGVASWYDVAKLIEYSYTETYFKELFYRCTSDANDGDSIPDNKIGAISYKRTPDKFSPDRTRAIRPVYSVLDTTKICKAFGITTQHWMVGVASVAAEYVTNNSHRLFPWSKDDIDESIENKDADDTN